VFIKGKDITGETAVTIDGDIARSERPYIISVKPLPVLHLSEPERECSNTSTESGKYCGIGIGSWGLRL